MHHFQWAYTGTKPRAQSLRDPSHFQDRLCVVFHLYIAPVVVFQERDKAILCWRRNVKLSPVNARIYIPHKSKLTAGQAR